MGTAAKEYKLTKNKLMITISSKSKSVTRKIWSKGNFFNGKIEVA